MGAVAKRIVSASALLLLAACQAHAHAPVADAASLTSAEAMACRGTAFDADAPNPVCLHRGIATLTPATDALKVSIAAPRAVRSGYDGGLVVEMRNTTADPLTFDVDSACGTFEAIASNDKTTSFETDCFGTCGGEPDPHVLRVTLEPGGVVKKRVKFFAVQTRVTMDDHDRCVAHSVGGLPPGDYDLRVTLPWTDPVPGDPDVTRPRVLEEKLSIVP